MSASIYAIIAAVVLFLIVLAVIILLLTKKSSGDKPTEKTAIGLNLPRRKTESAGSRELRNQIKNALSKWNELGHSLESQFGQATGERKVQLALQLRECYLIIGQLGATTRISVLPEDELDAIRKGLEGYMAEYESIKKEKIKPAEVPPHTEYPLTTPAPQTPQNPKLSSTILEWFNTSIRTYDVVQNDVREIGVFIENLKKELDIEQVFKGDPHLTRTGAKVKNIYDLWVKLSSNLGVGSMWKEAQQKYSDVVKIDITKEYTYEEINEIGNAISKFHTMIEDLSGYIGILIGDEQRLLLKTDVVNIAQDIIGSVVDE